MSRLASLSPAALKAFFSSDADTTLITLLTITGAGIVSPIRIADGYTQRLSETADDVTYGVVSRTNNFLFLPFSVSLPSEEVAAAPQCRITINDVTRYLTPTIRTIQQAPDVLVELVLMSTPNVVEASFPGFKMGAISYSADSITATLTIASLANEPFPAHGFTPNYFPGLF